MEFLSASYPHEKFRAVLEIDPGNREAREGIRAVADRYIALARAAMGRDAFDEADDLLVKARTAAPRHPDLTSATAALEEARAGARDPRGRARPRVRGVDPGPPGPAR